MKWHDQINQIFLTGTCGSVYNLFDKSISRNGALLCYQKKKKVTSFSVKKKAENLEIIAPIGLPITKESDAYNITDVGIEIRWNRKLKEDGIIKPKRHVKQKLEEWAPVQAQGLGWDGVTTGLARTLAKKTADIGTEGIRDSILRHNDLALQNPKYVQHAYKETQPVTMYADDEATMKRKIAESRKSEPIWKKLKQ